MASAANAEAASASAANAEAARLRAALSAQIDVVRALESSVGELSAAWDARRAARSCPQLRFVR